MFTAWELMTYGEQGLALHRLANDLGDAPGWPEQRETVERALADGLPQKLVLDAWVVVYPDAVLS